MNPAQARFAQGSNAMHWNLPRRKDQRPRSPGMRNRPAKRAKIACQCLGRIARGAATGDAGPCAFAGKCCTAGQIAARPPCGYQFGNVVVILIGGACRTRRPPEPGKQMRVGLRRQKTPQNPAFPRRPKPLCRGGKHQRVTCAFGSDAGLSLEEQGDSVVARVWIGSAA